MAWISAYDPGHNAYNSATEASPQLQLSGFIWGSCFAHTPGCSAAASPVHHGLAAPCLHHKGFCSHIASLCWLQQEQHCISASDGRFLDWDDRHSYVEHQLSGHKGLRELSLCLSGRSPTPDSRSIKGTCVSLISLTNWLKYTCYPQLCYLHYLVQHFIIQLQLPPSYSFLSLPEWQLCASSVNRFQVCKARAPWSHWPCCPLVLLAPSTTVF